MITLPERFSYLYDLALFSTVNGIETWSGIIALSSLSKALQNSATEILTVTVNSNDRTTPLTFTSTIGSTTTSQVIVSWTGSAPASSVFVPPANCPFCTSTVSAEIASYTLLIVACLMMVLFIDKI